MWQHDNSVKAGSKSDDLPVTIAVHYPEIFWDIQTNIPLPRHHCSEKLKYYSLT